VTKTEAKVIAAFDLLDRSEEGDREHYLHTFAYIAHCAISCSARRAPSQAQIRGALDKLIAAGEVAEQRVSGMGGSVAFYIRTPKS
jgi:hypothetical protein